MEWAILMSGKFITLVVIPLARAWRIVSSSIMKRTKSSNAQKNRLPDASRQKQQSQREELSNGKALPPNRKSIGTRPKFSSESIMSHESLRIAIESIHDLTGLTYEEIADKVMIGVDVLGYMKDPENKKGWKLSEDKGISWSAAERLIEWACSLENRHYTDKNSDPENMSSGPGRLYEEHSKAVSDAVDFIKVAAIQGHVGYLRLFNKLGTLSTLASWGAQDANFGNKMIGNSAYCLNASFDHITKMPETMSDPRLTSRLKVLVREVVEPMRDIIATKIAIDPTDSDLQYAHGHIASATARVKMVLKEYSAIEPMICELKQACLTDLNQTSGHPLHLLQLGSDLLRRNSELAYVVRDAIDEVLANKEAAAVFEYWIAKASSKSKEILKHSLRRRPASAAVSRKGRNALKSILLAFALVVTNSSVYAETAGRKLDTLAISYSKVTKDYETAGRKLDGIIVSQMPIYAIVDAEEIG